jgi:DNA invertase Pin-like site-specific DNA recombinase
VAQLERDLIAERVRNGLANAKAKGIRIGRLKTRDSDLIRKLRASGMTYRQIATIARCSSGAVSAELRALKTEKKKTEEKSYPENTSITSTSLTTPILQSNTQEIELDIDDFKIELDFAS